MVALFGAVALSGLHAQTVSTFATGFNGPTGMAFDTAGNLYVANRNIGTVSKVTTGGVVSTFATGFNSPYGTLVFDAAGNLYVANYGTTTVSKVTPGGVVSTFATGLNHPIGLAFDTAGNLYVGNYGNNTVSKVTPGGVVSTFATGVNGPTGLAFDAAGILYASNYGVGNVSKITTGGVVTTFATGFNSPFALRFDAAGILYVGSLSDTVVKTVTSGGVVSTFVTGLNAPAGLAFDATGNLYAANNGDGTVSKITIVVPLTIAGVSGPSSGSYKAGGVLSFTANFSAVVTATGTPRIVLTIGTAARYATYASGSGTAALVFSYAVQAGDTDPDGIAVTSPLDLNGGTINDTGSSAAATLTFTAPTTAGVLVDTTAPVITSSGTATATYGTAFSNYSIAATDAATITYGASNLPPGLVVDPSTGAITGTPTTAGSYSTTVTATDVAGNVASTTVAFTVNQITPTITWGAPTAITYGTALSSTQLNATTNVAGAFSYSPASGSVLAVGSRTLGVTFTPTDATNYATATGSVTLTVNTATLTIAADAKTRVYGAANPVLTATLSGFVNRETLSTSGVSGSAAVTTAATTTTAVGTTAITPALGTLAAANYNFGIFTPGVLTLTQAPLTVSGVTIADKIYDATVTATPVFTAATINGLTAGDTGSVTLNTGAAVATFATKTVAPAKSVTITGVTLAGSAAGNYLLVQPTGASAAIIAKTLTVTGTTAANKIYDATTVATLTTTAAVLAGVVGGDDVTLVTRGATGAFATATVAPVKPVTLTGFTFTGADAGNYVLAPLTTTAGITAATATLTLAALDQVYNGTSRAVTAITVPGGLAVTLTYAGASSSPTAAGSYAVAATISDANYQGSATGTLTIARAAQTISFVPIGTPPVGTPIALSASASSGLPVTFSLVSGNATVTGATLTTNSSATATVRATQAGDANFNAVSLDQVADSFNDSRLYAISARAKVGTGGDILIPGILIGGSGTRQVVVRAGGPAIQGVAGTLARPQLKLYQVGNPIPLATNTGWSSGSASDTAALQAAFTTANLPQYPVGSADCALLATVNAGSAYTATISGVGETTGVALVEVYEIGAGSARMTALSCRAQIGTGGDILIAGLVILGTSPKQVIIRAKGPGIVGVPGLLAQPTLKLYTGAGIKIAENIGWDTAPNAAALANATAAVGLSPLAIGSADCAILTTLAPGGYTAQVGSLSGATGVALIEVYEVP